MLTPEDANNLLVLLERVQITAKEAAVVVVLQQKLAGIINAKPEEVKEEDEKKVTSAKT